METASRYDWAELQPATQASASSRPKPEPRTGGFAADLASIPRSDPSVERGRQTSCDPGLPGVTSLLCLCPLPQQIPQGAPRPVSRSYPQPEQESVKV